MTTITAQVIKDSIANSIRLVTVHLHYPLVIHAELMTHRVFSRNARSSRAVPTKRMIQDVIDDPFVPLVWGSNQTGMQAGAEIDNRVFLGGYEGILFDRVPITYQPEQAWLWARDQAVIAATGFMEAEYHKQISNRLLAPFLHIDTLVTSTEWDNWFELRDHPMAEPHIEILAKEMRKAFNGSTPIELKFGQWHLPYADVNGDPDIEIKLSVARSARISYAPFDGSASIDAELDRYKRLVGSRPIHASPAEHQATPDRMIKGQWSNPQLHGNFKGWKQWRKTLELSLN